MSNNKSSSIEESILGTLLFFRKVGDEGKEYPLYSGETTFGGSTDVDIRIKISDERLLDRHCIINIEDTGLATLVNNGPSETVTVNDVPVRKVVLLRNNDRINIFNKLFQYCCDKVISEEVSKIQLQSKISTLKYGPKVKRLSVATPLQRQKKDTMDKGPKTTYVVKRLSVATPKLKPKRRSIPKTTSKLKSTVSLLPKKLLRYSVGNFRGRNRTRDSSIGILLDSVTPSNRKNVKDIRFSKQASFSDKTMPLMEKISIKDSPSLQQETTAVISLGNSQDENLDNVFASPNKFQTSRRRTMVPKMNNSENSVIILDESSKSSDKSVPTTSNNIGNFQKRNLLQHRLQDQFIHSTPKNNAPIPQVIAGSTIKKNSSISMKSLNNKRSRHSDKNSSSDNNFESCLCDNISEGDTNNRINIRRPWKGSPRKSLESAAVSTEDDHSTRHMSKSLHSKKKLKLNSRRSQDESGFDNQIECATNTFSKCSENNDNGIINSTDYVLQNNLSKTNNSFNSVNSEVETVESSMEELALSLNYSGKQSSGLSRQSSSKVQTQTLSANKSISIEKYTPKHDQSSNNGKSSNKCKENQDSTMEELILSEQSNASSPGEVTVTEKAKKSKSRIVSLNESSIIVSKRNSSRGYSGRSGRFYEDKSQKSDDILYIVSDYTASNEISKLSGKINGSKVDISEIKETSIDESILNKPNDKSTFGQKYRNPIMTSLVDSPERSLRSSRLSKTFANKSNDATQTKRSLRSKNLSDNKTQNISDTQESNVLESALIASPEQVEVFHSKSLNHNNSRVSRISLPQGADNTSSAGADVSDVNISIKSTRLSQFSAVNKSENSSIHKSEQTLPLNYTNVSTRSTRLSKSLLENKFETTQEVSSQYLSQFSTLNIFESSNAEHMKPDSGRQAIDNTFTTNQLDASDAADITNASIKSAKVTKANKSQNSSNLYATVHKNNLSKSSFSVFKQLDSSSNNLKLNNNSDSPLHLNDPNISIRSTRLSKIIPENESLNNSNLNSTNKEVDNSAGRTSKQNYSRESNLSREIGLDVNTNSSLNKTFPTRATTKAFKIVNLNKSYNICDRLEQNISIQSNELNKIAKDTSSNNSGLNKTFPMVIATASRIATVNKSVGNLDLSLLKNNLSTGEESDYGKMTNSTLNSSINSKILDNTQSDTSVRSTMLSESVKGVEFQISTKFNHHRSRRSKILNDSVRTNDLIDSTANVDRMNNSNDNMLPRNKSHNSSKQHISQEEQLEEPFLEHCNTSALKNSSESKAGGSNTSHKRIMDELDYSSTGCDIMNNSNVSIRSTGLSKVFSGNKSRNSKLEESVQEQNLFFKDLNASKAKNSRQNSSRWSKKLDGPLITELDDSITSDKINNTYVLSRSTRLSKTLPGNKSQNRSTLLIPEQEQSLESFFEHFNISYSNKMTENNSGHSKMLDDPLKIDKLDESTANDKMNNSNVYPRSTRLSKNLTGSRSSRKSILHEQGINEPAFEHCNISDSKNLTQNYHRYSKTLEDPLVTSELDSTTGVDKMENANISTRSTRLSKVLVRNKSIDSSEVSHIESPVSKHIKQNNSSSLENTNQTSVNRSQNSRIYLLDVSNTADIDDSRDTDASIRSTRLSKSWRLNKSHNQSITKDSKKRDSRHWKALNDSCGSENIVGTNISDLRVSLNHSLGKSQISSARSSRRLTRNNAGNVESNSSPVPNDIQVDDGDVIQVRLSRGSRKSNSNTILGTRNHNRSSNLYKQSVEKSLINNIKQMNDNSAAPKSSRISRKSLSTLGDQQKKLIVENHSDSINKRCKSLNQLYKNHLIVRKEKRNSYNPLLMTDEFVYSPRKSNIQCLHNSGHETEAISDEHSHNDDGGVRFSARLSKFTRSSSVGVRKSVSFVDVSKTKDSSNFKSKLSNILKTDDQDEGNISSSLDDLESIESSVASVNISVDSDTHEIEGNTRDNLNSLNVSNSINSSIATRGRRSRYELNGSRQSKSLDSYMENDDVDEHSMKHMSKIIQTNTSITEGTSDGTNVSMQHENPNGSIKSRTSALLEDGLSKSSNKNISNNLNSSNNATTGIKRCRESVGLEMTLKRRKLNITRSDFGKDTLMRLKRNSEKVYDSPETDLNKLRGIKKLLTTPKPAKSPRNDLTSPKGIKKLLATPRLPKSPRNDLTSPKGVKKLLASPKQNMSPRNDLTDIKGLKKLLSSPKPLKSPKNDLSDPKGIKRLMASQKFKRSPKNDLSDVRGVKKLLSSPKQIKSPKNDLSHPKGIKRLMTSPKIQKSPKNDLSDLRGVKRLMSSPKPQKSPRNDLSDLRGIKKLMTIPKTPKSPRNDLSNPKGVKRLMASPRHMKSPKNDLSNMDGVKELFSTALVSPTNEMEIDRKTNTNNKTRLRKRNVNNSLEEVTDINVDNSGVDIKDTRSMKESVKLNYADPAGMTRTRRGRKHDVVDNNVKKEEITSENQTAKNTFEISEAVVLEEAKSEEVSSQTRKTRGRNLRNNDKIIDDQKIHGKLEKQGSASEFAPDNEELDMKPTRTLRGKLNSDKKQKEKVEDDPRPKRANLRKQHDDKIESVVAVETEKKSGRKPRKYVDKTLDEEKSEDKANVETEQGSNTNEIRTRRGRKQADAKIPVANETSKISESEKAQAYSLEPEYKTKSIMDVEPGSNKHEVRTRSGRKKEDAKISEEKLDESDTKTSNTKKNANEGKVTDSDEVQADRENELKNKMTSTRSRRGKKEPEITTEVGKTVRKSVHTEIITEKPKNKRINSRKLTKKELELSIEDTNAISLNKDVIADNKKNSTKKSQQEAKTDSPVEVEARKTRRRKAIKYVEYEEPDEEIEESDNTDVKKKRGQKKKEDLPKPETKGMRKQDTDEVLADKELVEAQITANTVRTRKISDDPKTRNKTKREQEGDTNADFVAKNSKKKVHFEASELLDSPSTRTRSAKRKK